MQAKRLSGSLLCALAAAALCPALLTSAPATAARTRAAAGPVPATAGGTWGNVQQIPGLAALNGGNDAEVDSMSCVSAGNCTAGGNYLTSTHGNFQAFVATETNGTWGTAQKVPGILKLNKFLSTLTAMSCASVGNCSAGGYYTDASGAVQAFVVTETNGTWGTAQEVVTKNTRGHAQISSMSCAAPGNCTAVGWYLHTFTSRRVFMVEEKNGVWGTARSFPGLGAQQGAQDTAPVSCRSVGNCSSGGGFSDFFGHGQGYVVSETNGTWGAITRVPGLAAFGPASNVNSVSCGASGDCAAGGEYVDNNNKLHAFVADQTNGIWGNAQEITGTGALGHGNREIDSMSCASAGNCSAVGDVRQRSGGQSLLEPFVVSEKNGTWGNATLLPGIAALSKSNAAFATGLSCATAGNCAVVGTYTGDAPDDNHLFVASQANGTWGNAEEIPGLAAVNGLAGSTDPSVSCGATDNCAAGGQYTSPRGNVAFVVNQS